MTNSQTERWKGKTQKDTFNIGRRHNTQKWFTNKSVQLLYKLYLLYKVIRQWPSNIIFLLLIHSNRLKLNSHFLKVSWGQQKSLYAGFGSSATSSISNTSFDLIFRQIHTHIYTTFTVKSIKPMQRSAQVKIFNNKKYVPGHT